MIVAGMILKVLLNLYDFRLDREWTTKRHYKQISFHICFQVRL